MTLIKKNKPKIILVDYEDNKGVSNFACILADLGTAGNAGNFGGTPLYAGQRTLALSPAKQNPFESVSGFQEPSLDKTT